MTDSTQGIRPSVALHENRAAIRRLVARHRSTDPKVFGSVARGTDHADSDLDILVVTLPDATLFDLGGLQMELEAMLNVRVNVLTAEELPLRWRTNALAEAIPI